MKIQRLLLWIIALSLISSCAVIEEQMKNITHALTLSEQPSSLVETDKPSSSQSSQSEPFVKPQVVQKETVDFASVTKKAKQGDAKAQTQLGWMYEQGYMVAKNYQEAVKWYRKAAEQGYAKAEANLGFMYEQGYGVTKNSQEAVKWYRKAAEQGDADAYGNWGWLLITQGKFDEAQTLTEKAHQLDPQVYAWTINLGHTYLLKDDRKTAKSYYKKALPLIKDDASFERGPVADFQLFIKKGWQVKACRSELAWFRKAFEQLKLAKNYDEQALQYYKQGKFKQALPLLEKGYRLSKEVLGEKHPDTLTSLNNLAFIYKEVGRLSEALPLYEKGYRLSKEVSGAKHPSTLTSLNNLAGIYKVVGRLSEALLLSEKGYRLRQEVLGAKHPNTLTSLNNLAVIYNAVGHLSEALPLFEKGYRLSQEVLGAKHPSTLNSLNNLAGIYEKVGRLSEALPLYEKSYRLHQEVLGSEHPSTLNSLNGLASIYHEVGRLSEALSLYEKTYRLRKKLFGGKAPDTLISLNNLAEIYRAIGRLSEALPLFEKGYRLSKEVLGAKHSFTLISLNNLAGIYNAVGRLSEALPLYEKCYHLSQEALGAKHPFTLTSLNNLAGIYQNVGRLSEALPLYEKGYHLSQKLLGAKHPSTLKSLNNLASIYNAVGRLSEALPLYEKCYHLRQEVLGTKHPNTVESLNNLATIYKAVGRLSEALPLSEKGYRLSQDLLGAKHPDTIVRLNNLAVIYQDVGRLSEALPLSEKGYRLSQEVLGVKHPFTLTSLGNLAGIYQDVGRLSEALPLEEKGYRQSQEVLGAKHPSTLNSLNNLAGIYKAVGRLSEALPLYEKSYHLRQEVLGAKHPFTLTSLNNLASIYKAVGRLSEALPLYEKSYHLRQEVLGAKHPGTLISLNNLGGIYLDVGRLSEALPLSEKYYRLCKEVLGAKHPYTLHSINNLAVIYKATERFSEALPLYEKGYRLRQEVLGAKHPDTLESLDGLAYFYLKQGQIKKAIEHYEKLVKGVEHLRSGDFSAENRQALFKGWVPAYFALSNLYIKKSRFKDAFRLAELSKARTLLESLAARRAAQESGLSKAEQDKLKDYEARLAFFNDKIGKALQDNRIEDRVRLETDKNQLIGELNQFERKLKAKYPKYAELSDVQILSAKKGAKHLPKNAVLISYLVYGSQVLAFTLENNGKLTARDLGTIKNLNKDLDAYSELMARGKLRRVIRKKNKDDKMLNLKLKLGKRLLEPLKDIIKDKTHWIISPSGALAVIPFETLHLEGEKQPVIAQHQISYVQSLSILAMLQKRDKAYKRIKNRGNLFAMGAPIYQKVGKMSKSTKPSSTDVKIARGLVQKSYDSTRALRQLNLQWQNLPGTLKELSELKKVFRRATIYKQKQATEAKLKSLNKQRVLETYRYLVFSAHGFLSPDVPALSSLVLGQVDNPKGIDGYVTAGEWPGYDLKSDLMVLSACETGLGEVVGGEGVLGLPYALFVAGNKNTLLTLWSISDEIRVEFMTSFFKKLKAGKGQIEALTATKREFIKKGGKYANPVYWAAFVLYGV